MVEMYDCVKCGQYTLHHHLHNTAYDIPATHIAGSERFKCTECGHITWAGDLGAIDNFPFTLDKGRI